MRALLLVSLVVGTLASRMSLNEACLFAGARFSRVDSSCVEGFCTGFTGDVVSRRTRAAGHGSPIPCSLALDSVTGFLSESAIPVRRSKRPRLVSSGEFPELLRLLRTSVLPQLEGLELGANIDSATLDASLRTFESRARVITARNFAEWQEATVPVLVASPEFAELTRLASEFVLRLVEYPLTFGRLRQSLRAVVHFYFDVSALVGRHMLNPAIIPIASLVVRRSIPRYRALDGRESCSAPAWEGVPRDAPTALLVAGAVERLADMSRVLLNEDITALLQLLSGWEESPPSAAKSFLSDQIATGLCAQLNGMIARMPGGSRFMQTMLWLSTSLLDFCRPYIPMVARRDFRDRIAQHVSGGFLRIPDSQGLSAVEFLLDDSTRWYAGFSESTSADERYIFAGRVLHEFVDARVTWTYKAGQQVPRFRGDAREDAVGFGRALALAILHGVSIRALNIHIAIVELLHPRFRHSATDLTQVSWRIAPATRREIIRIVHGLEDILCRGGFEMFSDSEWLALFGHAGD